MPPIHLCPHKHLLVLSRSYETIHSNACRAPANNKTEVGGDYGGYGDDGDDRSVLEVVGPVKVTIDRTSGEFLNLFQNIHPAIHPSTERGNSFV